MWFVSHVSREVCVAPISSSDNMKKKSSQGSSKKRALNVTEEKEANNIDTPKINVDSLDEEDQGFGGWLRSPDGLENMKLFVIANSIVMLVTLVYPHIQTTFGIIYDMVYGPDSIY